jgi:type II secretory pathway pseudopilin PulG
MHLRGQESDRSAGYAMAALLVALAVMAVMMTVALPVWRHEAQRQREDDLIWRGNQYVRAIRLYQMKFGTLPPSLDVLVQGRFLRQKYKDPITKDDFELLGPAAAAQPGLAPGQGQSAPGRPGQPPTPSSVVGTPQTPTQFSTSGPAMSGGNVPGGLTGVRSKSKDESIKIYQGRTHYNEWTFMFVGQAGLGPGRGGPNGQPGRGPNGQPIGPNGRPIGPQRIGPNGQPLPPIGGPNGPGRGPIGPGGNPMPPPGFPPNTGRRGGGL